MQGDKLAKGAPSATFSVAPGLKFNEEDMKRDLTLLPAATFCTKYMITQYEYELMRDSNGEEVNTFAKEMSQRADAVERALKADDAQDASLKRTCFLRPYVPIGLTGRVIVDRDVPVKKRSSIALPKSMRTDKTLLPTTGHVIVAQVIDHNGTDISKDFLGMRVLFGQMSGSAICFKGYPTWTLLELAEIMCIVDREDIDVIEEPLEPMV
jgi:hypothetical protein